MRSKLYLELVKNQQDSHGYIHSDECDSLLFTSLAIVGGMECKDYSQAFNTDKMRWERRPCEKPCWPDHSKSSISRDMMLGPLYVALFRKNYGIVRTVIDQMNQIVMGDYTGFEGLSRVIPSPGLYATAKIIERSLFGKGPGLWRFIPVGFHKPQGGYRDHLTALHVVLRALALGYKTEKDLEIIEKLYSSNYMNPLFATLHDEMEESEYSEKLWPMDRLPNTKDRLAPWLPERDRSSYFPGTGTPKVHTGMDLLFCLKIGKLWHELELK